MIEKDKRVKVRKRVRTRERIKDDGKNDGERRQRELWDTVTTELVCCCSSLTGGP